MDVLRRDEIWFTEKNNGVSTLNGLRDIAMESKGRKARRDYNHEMNYMKGNYGAKPQISRFKLAEQTDEA